MENKKRILGYLMAISELMCGSIASRLLWRLDYIRRHSVDLKGEGFE